MKPASAAIRFFEGLKVPEGPSAGEPVKLAPFQKQFIRGVLADDVTTAVLSIGRCNGKSAISAGNRSRCAYGRDRAAGRLRLANRPARFAKSGDK